MIASGARSSRQFERLASFAAQTAAICAYAHKLRLNRRDAAAHAERIGWNRTCLADPVARFLVVDDDHATLRGMTTLLIDDGHDVSPFASGGDAVKALSTARFDAVVTDLEMPRVDGRAVVRATRTHHPDACLVVVSGRAEENLDDLVNAGACIVAQKPLDYEEVTRSVHECRARGGPGAHGRCHMRSRPHGHQLLPLRRK